MNKLILFFTFTISFSKVYSSENIEDRLKYIYLVHVSEIMAEDNTKISGQSFKEININNLNNINTDKKSKRIIDSVGHNIHSRMTLHHCVCSVTPKETHGSIINILGTNYKTGSCLYNNEDNMAYMDLYSSFSGEILGGKPDDIMTFGNHVYGTNSFIIIPCHRTQEFHNLNPDFQGRVIQFDPKKIKLHEKVNDFFEKISNYLDSNKVRTKEFFKENNLMWSDHNKTSFATLEKLLRLYYDQIRRGQIISELEKWKSSLVVSLNLISADRIACDISIIKFFFEDVIENSKKTLSPERLELMQQWRTDTLSWLNLFTFDAHLRKTQGKSIFQIETPFSGFIKYRSSWSDLERLASQLTPLEDQKSLNLKSAAFFPEFLDKMAVVQSADTAGNLLKLKKFSTLIQLSQYLIGQGYADEGHALVVLKILKNIEQKFKENSAIDSEIYKLLQESTINIKNFDLIIPHLEQFKENIIWSDSGFMNQRSLNILNSELGQYSRQKQGDAKIELNFFDLIKQKKDLEILFSNDSQSVETNENLEIKILSLLREKVRKKSFAYSGQFKSKALVNYKKEGNNLLGSISFNPYTVRGLIDMADFIKRASTIISYSPLSQVDEWLSTLMDLGCCTSLSDLTYKILPLKNISEIEIKAIINSQIRLQSDLTNVSVIDISKELTFNKLNAYFNNYLAKVDTYQSKTSAFLKDQIEKSESFNSNEYSFGDIVDKINELEKEKVVDSFLKHPYFYMQSETSEESMSDKLIIEPNFSKSNLLREYLKLRFETTSFPGIKKVYQKHLNRLNSPLLY